MIQLFAWFAQFWRQRKLALTGVVLLTIVTTALKTILPILLVMVIDALAGANANNDNIAYALVRSIIGPMQGASTTDTALALLTVYGIVALIGEVAMRILPLSRAYLNIVFAAMMRNTYFEVFTRRNAVFFGKYRTGDLVSRLTDDIDGQWDRLHWYACSGILRPFEALLVLSMTLSAMAYYSWELTLWSFLPLPFLIVLLAKTEDKMVKYTNAKQESVSECYDALEACFSGIRIVKSTLSEEDQLRKYEEVTQRRIAREKDFLRINQLLTFLTMLVNHTGTIIVIFVGTYFVINQQLTLGQLLLFVIYLERLVEPIWTMSWFYASSRQMLRYVERLHSTESQSYAEHAPAQHNGQQAKATPEEFQALEFSNVSFRYLPEGSRDVVEQLSFSLRKGEILAIVGPVGAGKTTLLELIVNNIQPTSGQICLNGQELSAFSSSALAQSVGYIRQESLLFSETVANNIALGDVFTDDDVQQALETAVLLKEMEHLPQGLNTMLGQRGISLSGGQKQRLSIARTLVRKPSLLLMDDCTAAMDARTEAQFWQSCKRNLPNAACIIVTHRMATARQADRILVLDKGRIQEQGSHSELMARNGAYRKFMMQHDIEERLTG